MKNATLLVVFGRSAKPVDLQATTEVALDQNLHLSVLIWASTPPVGFAIKGAMSR